MTDPTNTTIEEYKAAKAAMEATILAAIGRLEDATGLVVGRIDLAQNQLLSRRSPKTSQVSSEVKL